MYYLYILYSEKYDRYYVGQTNDPERRLEEHNSALKNSYTAKYRPWKMVGKFEIGPSLGVARKVENHIKRQNSRTYIEEILTRGSISKLISRYGVEKG